MDCYILPKLLLMTTLLFTVAFICYHIQNIDQNKKSIGALTT